MFIYPEWNTGEVTQVIIQSAIDEYNRTNDKNVVIEPIWAGRDVNVKLMAMIQGGNPPDFYDEDPDIIENSLGKAGLALNLLPYLKTVKAADQDKPVIDTFSKGFFDAVTYRGEVNCLPIQQYINMIWYDKAMFRKWGITKVPNTWPEFLSVCETIKSKGVAPIIMDGGVDFYNLYWYSHLADRLEGMDALLNAIYDKTGASWDKLWFLKAAQLLEAEGQRVLYKGFEGYQFPAGQIDWAQRSSFLVHATCPLRLKMPYQVISSSLFLFPVCSKVKRWAV